MHVNHAPAIFSYARPLPIHSAAMILIFVSVQLECLSLSRQQSVGCSYLALVPTTTTYEPHAYVGM